MTDDQIAGEQAKFLTKQAADAAKATADAAAKAKGVVAQLLMAAEIEKARKDAVSKTSIPKSAATCGLPHPLTKRAGQRAATRPSPPS